MRVAGMQALAAASLGLALVCAPAAAQDPAAPFRPEQIRQGATIFALNCATCHGTRMRNPQWAIDLHTFPRGDHARFVDSVTNGKGNMPAWDDVLNPDDIEALWAYVVAGEPEDGGPR
jgi:mono/diheme cytochrome c family protein